MADMWNTPATSDWLSDVEITPELLDECRQALRDYENDPVAQAELERRLAPYRTKIHGSSLTKLIP